MSTRQLSIQDFAAHCVDELAMVEKEATVVELVRNGEVVAFLYPAPHPKGNTGTLADWMGTGAGYTLAPGATLEDPAFSPGDWEDTADSQD